MTYQLNILLKYKNKGTKNSPCVLELKLGSQYVFRMLPCAMREVGTSCYTYSWACKGRVDDHDNNSQFVCCFFFAVSSQTKSYTHWPTCLVQNVSNMAYSLQSFKNVSSLVITLFLLNSFPTIKFPSYICVGVHDIFIFLWMK